jgi:mono/diheme cytochrome c family protein
MPRSIVFALALLAVPAAAQEIDYGALEYATSCAACHGPAGRGDGPFASELKTPPADLTLLAERNGGEFPYWKVYASIDGRYVVPGHGTRDMPVWGDEFLAIDVPEFGAKGGEIVTRERILALAAYLAALQR